MGKRSIRIKSLTEYVSKILKETKYYYFRGERLAERKLLSKIGQSKDLSGNPINPTYEKSILRDFHRKAVLQLAKEPTNDLEWLMLARHHGLPTRIIDFTSNPLVALYFAVEKPMPKKDKGKTSIVYGIKDMKTSKQESIKDPFHIEYDLIINPFCIHERMFLQQSRFLLVAKPLEELNKNNMLKIEIPDEHRTDIKWELNKFGINSMNLFRDLDSIADFVEWSRTNRY